MTLLSTIVPNNYAMSWEAVKCWLKLSNYDKVWAQGPDLDYNRNMVWKQAVKYNETKEGHLIMIDSDIVFTPEDVAKIESHLDNGLDAVTGIYPVGQPPYPPCIFERVVNKVQNPEEYRGSIIMSDYHIQGDYKLTTPKEGLNEIGACGGGFLGINKNIINKLPKDPFDNIREGEIFHGEDISFCHRLRELGFKLWADSEIKLGHIRTQVIY